MFLILGASGTIGSRIARRLLDRGDAVRAVSRNRTRLSELTRLGATPIEGDLRASTWMTPALEGVKTLVLATHGLVPPRRDNHPGITDDAGNRRIIDAAKRTGVGHVIFLSATSGANSPALFGQVKYRAEEYLRASGLAYTIIRPPAYIETHALQLLGDPLRKQGSVLIFGRGTTRLNWISAEDVVEFMARAIRPDSPRNRIFTIGGPDNLSRLEVLAAIEKVLGRSGRRRHVPVAALRGLKFLAGPINPGMRYLLDLAILESTKPDDPSWVPRTLDWMGPTTVRDVIERWAGNFQRVK